MNSDRLIQIPDLSYYIHPDGPWIDLEQNAGCGEVDRVTLHRIHLRLLLEETGHLLPPPPADELAKRLARQLCELRLELANEYGRSPSLNEALTMLGAFCDSLPDSVFPFELYPDDSPELAPRNTNPDRPDFQLTHSPKEQKQLPPPKKPSTELAPSNRRQIGKLAKKQHNASKLKKRPRQKTNAFAPS